MLQDLDQRVRDHLDVQLGSAPQGQADLEQLADLAAKVFGAGEAPSDEGILESQPILGSIA